jgi:hypothetical protein
MFRRHSMRGTALLFPFSNIGKGQPFSSHRSITLCPKRSGCLATDQLG